MLLICVLHPSAYGWHQNLHYFEIVRIEFACTVSSDRTETYFISESVTRPFKGCRIEEVHDDGPARAQVICTETAHFWQPDYHWVINCCIRWFLMQRKMLSGWIVSNTLFSKSCGCRKVHFRRCVLKAHASRRSRRYFMSLIGFEWVVRRFIYNRKNRASLDQVHIEIRAENPRTILDKFNLSWPPIYTRQLQEELFHD